MLPTNALAAFEYAEGKLRAGEFEEALQWYLRVIRGVPTALRARFRIADALLNLNGARQLLHRSISTGRLHSLLSFYDNLVGGKEYGTTTKGFRQRS